jgi:hypothetical protein
MVPRVTGCAAAGKEHPRSVPTPLSASAADVEFMVTLKFSASQPPVAK